jgi:hypothetical protein
MCPITSEITTELAKYQQMKEVNLWISKRNYNQHLEVLVHLVLKNRADSLILTKVDLTQKDGLEFTFVSKYLQKMPNLKSLKYDSITSLPGSPSYPPIVIMHAMAYLPNLEHFYIDRCSFDDKCEPNDFDRAAFKITQETKIEFDIGNIFQ